LDNRLLSLIEAIGNDRANAILEGQILPDEKISPSADQEARVVFARQKYQECRWVRGDPVDLAAAVAGTDVIMVLHAIAQLRGRREWDFNLFAAASYGDPAVCLLVGLHTQALDALDAGGWSALSYAAFYGKLEAAEALISIGADPKAAPNAHPYAIAAAGTDPNLVHLFEPYWTGGPLPVQQFTPPMAFGEPKDDDDGMLLRSRFGTLHILSRVNRRG
jgi:hypothetical protein